MTFPTKTIETFPNVGDVFLTRSGTIYTIMRDKVFSYTVCIEGSPNIQHEFEVPDSQIVQIISIPTVDWQERFRPSIAWHLTNIKAITNRISDIDALVTELREENNDWSLLDVPIWATAHSPRVTEYVGFVEGYDILGRRAVVSFFDFTVMQQVFREEEWLNKFCQENNAVIERAMAELFMMKKQLISYRGGINPYSLVPMEDEE